MPQIYEIIYKPWKDNQEGKPWKYSGSDYKDNPKYLGSVSSSVVESWSEGMTVRDWWKKQIKNNPDNFEKKILISCSSRITRKELQALESSIQTAEDHRGSKDYFNKTNKHFNCEIASSPLKGLTYEEIYGKENAEKIKEQRSKTQQQTRKSKSWNSNKNGKLTGLNKGLTYEEIYGKEKAEKIKEQRSATLTGIKRSESTKRKNSDHMKNLNKNNRVVCEHCLKDLDYLNYIRWHGNKCKSKLK